MFFAFFALTILKASQALWIQGFQKLLVDDGYGSLAGPSIPSSPPFHHCSSVDDDLFFIDWITIFPNPLAVDATFLFQMNGTFARDIEANATVFLNLTWNDSPPQFRNNSSLWGTYDFCSVFGSIEQDSLRDQECPPVKGNALLRKLGFVPFLYPFGNYTLEINGSTKDNNPLFCIQGDFEIKSKFSYLLAGTSIAEQGGATPNTPF
ncbi:hypothetical protein BDY21DRAFT_354775 [Lineolata rhizophorae]|uniref:Phosphatidylglycerol/phosphatidylinositol transfer protein n=1 Tax=Lineolata rhizophorae TaxID=578093 RepID=A0A6A6NQJ1_9PEZI|nr:hypothetical protein BDY21DRAFT_354775 [Lineolata rhizophorae]